METTNFKTRMAEKCQASINNNKFWKAIKPTYDAFQRDTSIVFIAIFSCILGLIGGAVDSVVTLRMAELPRLVMEGSAITTPILCMGVYYLINNLDGILSRGTAKVVYNRTINKQMKKLIAKEFTCDIRYIMSTHSGKMMADINGYADCSANLFMYYKRIIFFIPQFIVLAIKVSETCGVKAFLIDIGIIIVLSLFGYFGASTVCNMKDRIDANSKVRWITQDNMQSIKTLRYLGKKEFAMNRLEKAQDEAVVYSLQLLRQLVFGTLSTVVNLIPLLTILISDKELTMDGVTYILLSSGYIFGTAIDNIIDMVDIYTTRSDYKATIKTLEKEVEEVYDALSDGIIVDSNMIFGYPESDIIMTTSGFTIETGKRYVVTGESGQGKSTLANLLVGVLKPVEGKIKRVHTFYIHQDSECLDSSIRDNLCFGQNISDETIFEYLDKVNLGDWVRSLPDGLETRLGERGTKASSGQKQRLNILRSVFKMLEEDSDTLMILDEPTSNLDFESEKLVCDLINDVCKTTLIVITHREAIEGICNHEIRVQNHHFELVK